MAIVEVKLVTPGIYSTWHVQREELRQKNQWQMIATCTAMSDALCNISWSFCPSLLKVRIRLITV